MVPVRHSELGRAYRQGAQLRGAGAFTSEFFVNLLNMDTEWSPSESASGVYQGRDRNTGAPKWTGTAVDLVFGSNSQLRAIAEVYGSGDGAGKFVQDVVAAWNKVVRLDRFDLVSRRFPV